MNLMAHEPADRVTQPDESGRRYNDDLLIHEVARQRAQREHAGVFHALDNQALRADFVAADAVANAQKKRSQAAGVWAVVGALTALAGAASEPLWHGAPDAWRVGAGAALALLGLGAFAIAGCGLLYGRQKEAWLTLRLKTERMRQFHFQAIVFFLPEVVSSMKTEQDRKNYRVKLDGRYASFVDDLKKERFGNVAAVVDHTRAPAVWVVGRDHPPPPPGPSPQLEQVLQAYDVFRFAEQEGYAERMLRKSNAPTAGATNNSRKSPRSAGAWYPGMSLPLRAKAHLLRVCLWSALMALVALHAVVVAGAFTDAHYLHGAWLHVSVVVTALVAIAAKTLTDGLAVTRDIERYEEYYAVVTDLRRRFLTSSGVDERLNLMVEMEREAYEEMRAFLRSHTEATFVM